MNQAERDHLLTQIADNTHDLPERVTKLETRFAGLSLVTQEQCGERREQRDFIRHKENTVTVARIQAAATVRARVLQTILAIIVLGIGALIGSWLS